MVNQMGCLVCTWFRSSWLKLSPPAGSSASLGLALALTVYACGCSDADPSTSRDAASPDGYQDYAHDLGETPDGSPESLDGERAACPWSTLADLDDDAAAWGIYKEQAPQAVLESVVAPSTGSGPALRCGLAGGEPYSNVHCYRNLSLSGSPRSFIFRLSFWYSPPSTPNNQGQPSVVQAMEFSLSKWDAGARYELALQLENVGVGAPRWRYWDANQSMPERWVALEGQPPLAAEQWHTLEIRGQGSEGTVHYRGFSIDGVFHPIDRRVSAAAASGEPDRLAVAVQVDGNGQGIPWDMMIDDVQVATCEDSDCPDPNVYYRDSDGDGFGSSFHSTLRCQRPPGYVTEQDDCDDADPLLKPGSASPVFDLERCGQGALLEGMSWSPGDGSWQIYTDGLGSSASLSPAKGCHDAGLGVSYALPASPQPNWIALRKVLPASVDVSHADFLLAPVRGDASALPRTVEFKLEDSAGCRATVPFTAMSCLPVFRTIVMSLQQFAAPDAGTCTKPTLDFTSIHALEIGVSEIGDDVPSPGSAASGQLTLDDITFVGRDAVAKTTTSFECVSTRGDVMGRIARTFLRRQQPHGFIASWYLQAPPTYNIYTQALNLIVLSREYARTGRSEYRSAATKLADRLVALQQGGGWVDSYAQDASGLLIPSGTASWVGNVSWAVLGLDTFVRQAAPAGEAPYANALAQARTWLEQRMADYEAAGGAPGGITDGTEGNLSSYFALRAAGGMTSSAALAAFLMAKMWDSGEQRLRMGVGNWGLAIDVAGNWGAAFLRSIHDDPHALAGLGLAAGIFPVRSFDGATVGLGDIAGPWQPTVEFTGQYAAAGGYGAAWLMQQVLLLEDPNDPGAFPGAPDDFGGGAGWNTAMTGTSPSAWVYLAYAGGFLQGESNYD
jgi:hypothetical protein